MMFIYKAVSLKKLLNKHIKCYATFCGREFKVGDVIVSKRSANGHSKHYHEECARRLWII